MARVLNVTGLPMDRQMSILAVFEEVNAQVARLEGELAEERAERDVAQETVVALSSVAQERDEARAERDAAIERGKRAMHECSSYFNAWRVWKQKANSFEVQLMRTALEREIRVVLAATPKGSDDPYYRGRLSGLLFVRDRILTPAEKEAPK